MGQWYSDRLESGALRLVGSIPTGGVLENKI